MSQISVIGCKPHTRYLFSTLVYLSHDLVLDDGRLDVDWEVPDLETRLQFKAGLVRGRISVTAELSGIYTNSFVA